MTSALTFKELRESAGIAAVGLAALLLLAVTSIGWNPFGWAFSSSSRPGAIPFISDSFTWQFAMAAGALAIALGFKQSLGDLIGEGQLFLLHRPVPRRTVYLTKVLVGLSLYLGLTGLAIAIYVAWAATEGTHASPFAWSMTLTACSSWIGISLVYLGAFLSGIRPAAWLGTRLMPLAAACALALVASTIPAIAGFAVAVIAGVALVVLILFVAETRDFA